MAEQNQAADSEAAIVDSAVAEGGAYEIIRKRLIEQGRELNQKVGQLNTARLEEFGSSEMIVTGRVRVRTENNCVARDMVQVGEHLLHQRALMVDRGQELALELVPGAHDVAAPERAEVRVQLPLEPAGGLDPQLRVDAADGERCGAGSQGAEVYGDASRQRTAGWRPAFNLC